jgi:hypothetical protein
MIVSVHLADVGIRDAAALRRRPPQPEEIAGLTYAEPVIAAPLGGGLLPAPELGRAGLIAAWEDDASLDEFLAGHPVARRLAGGWRVRLEPLHVFGAWAGMPGLPREPRPLEDDEPVVALTLGRLRLRRALPFLRSAAPAEAAAVAHPGLLAATGLARPPHLVSTFSLWRGAGEMKEYAFGGGGAHQAAVLADRERPYHHESAFIRFRPYASHGSWDGRDPLAGTVRSGDAPPSRSPDRAV